jgi:hypothetical protein
MTKAKTFDSWVFAALIAGALVHPALLAQESPQAAPVKPSAATGASAQTAGTAAAKPAVTGASAKASGAAAPAAAAAGAKPAGTPVRYRPERFAGRAGTYYRLVWGIEDLSVRSAESGEVIRFSYRVLDPNKARALNDKANEPTLIDPRAGVQLVVPQMDKIGQLRQSAPPEAGRAYWMAFSNKGRPVKRGDRVIVQIRQFRADGLVVD